jgi:hypothetical protein
MKKLLLSIVVSLTLAVPTAFTADSGGHGHSAHAKMNGLDHEVVIDGIKVTFSVNTMAEAMKSMGMKLPKGVKETHHISLNLKDMKSGKSFTEGEIKVKLLRPDKIEKIKDMVGMDGHFGADFEMEKKGKYGVMCKFKIADGKERQTKFWYEVK